MYEQLQNNKYIYNKLNCELNLPHSFKSFLLNMTFYMVKENIYQYINYINDTNIIEFKIVYKKNCLTTFPKVHIYIYI